MPNVRRLIAHAFPLKQASLDSVHEKNVRHGHISPLLCVQDPFGSLLAKAKGSVLIGAREVAEAAERM